MYQKIKTTDENGNLITLRYAAEKWLEERRLFVKPSTYARYIHTLRIHILPHLEHECIGKLDTGRLNLYLQMLLSEGRIDKKGGLAPKTVYDIYVIVKAIIRFAEKNYQISGYLPRTSNLWKRGSHVTVMDVPSRVKLETFLLSNTANPCCLGILLCLYTGMRLGEICALKWENIHLEGGFIRIASTLQRIQNVEDDSGKKTRIICSPPKSRASSREIPLPGFLLNILRLYPPKSDLNLYFLTGTCRFVEPRTYQNCFKSYLKLNQLPDINFHALRHTFATRCVIAGVDIKSLSEILGHSSVQMTLNYYVHPSLEDKRRQIELISQYM